MARRRHDNVKCKMQNAKCRGGHLDTATIGNVFGEHARPRVWSATAASLTSGGGFSEGAEPRTRGRVRSPESDMTGGVSDLANRVAVVLLLVRVQENDEIKIRIRIKSKRGTQQSKMHPMQRGGGRILTLPPIGVPRLRGFLEQGSPDRLKAELRTGQALGLPRGQCQDAPRGGSSCARLLPIGVAVF